MSIGSDKNYELSPSVPGAPGAVAAAPGETIDLTPILECLELLKTLVQANNDASALAEIMANLQALCDKLLEQITQNDTVISSLDTVIAELMALCAKILEGNESLETLFAELMEVCEKLLSLQEDITAIKECLESASQEVTCGDVTEKALTVHPSCAVLDDCTPDVIPDANYDGAIAWVTGRPMTNVTWELIDNRDPLNQVVVATGSNFGNFIAQMESLGYSQWSSGETHYFCPCPPGLVNAGDYFVTADGNTVSKPACLSSGEVPQFPEKAIEGEPVSAQRTKDCNSDALLAAMETAVQKLCEQSAGMVDCQTCAVFIINADTIVNNVITGVQGSTGQIEPLSEPATGPVEFANAVAALGYVVDSVSGDRVTVCGTELIYSYEQADGTIVPADDFITKQGQLVCDPAGTAALCAKLDAQTGLLQSMLEVLNKMCCVEPTECAVTLTSDNGNEGWNWTSGPTAGDDLVYPTPIDTPEVQDFKTTVTADCEALAACYPELETSTQVRLRFTFCHEQLGPGHSGFIFVVAGGTAVAVSPNNTTAPSASNGQNQQIGTAIGDPDDAGPQERWVEYLVPKDSLCGEGVVAQSGGFQGFDSGGVFNESLAKQTTVSIAGVA